MNWEPTTTALAVFRPLSLARSLDITTMFKIRAWERYQFLIDYEHEQASRLPPRSPEPFPPEPPRIPHVIPPTRLLRR